MFLQKNNFKIGFDFLNFLYKFSEILDCARYVGWTLYIYILYINGIFLRRLTVYFTVNYKDKLKLKYFDVVFICKKQLFLARFNYEYSQMY